MFNVLLNAPDGFSNVRIATGEQSSSNCDTTSGTCSSHVSSSKNKLGKEMKKSIEYMEAQKRKDNLVSVGEEGAKCHRGKMSLDCYQYYKNEYSMYDIIKGFPSIQRSFKTINLVLNVH